AFNAAGDSAASNTLTVTTAAASSLPMAPTNLAAAVSANGQVTLSWSDNSANETTFVIQRRYSNWIWGEIGSVNQNVTSYTDTGSYPNVEYEYRVLASNNLGVSDWSNGVIVLTSTRPAVPPAMPQSFRATAISATQVNLTWSDVATDEVGYKIDRRLAGGAWAQIVQTAANSAAYSDTTVSPGQTYEYRIRAAGSSLDSEFAGSVSVTTPGSSGGTAPVAPGSLTGVVTTKPRVLLRWQDRSSDETSFVIQRRFTSWIWGDVGTVPANTIEFLDTTSIGNVTYEYRVVAQNGGGASPFSNSVIVSTA
ncbi:MAG TPA: fibronectin type III domain-containing protein, partial [Tepidisphaeraceae bacterium]